MPSRVKFEPFATFLDAASEGNLEEVQTLFHQIQNPSRPNSDGLTALHLAVCAEAEPTVKFLIQNCVDVNATCSEGWTPLHCAAATNNLTIVKLLIENGGDVNAETFKDEEGDGEEFGGQTPADNCFFDEDFEQGRVETERYFAEISRRLSNQQEVYAIYDYESNSSDELSFRAGEQLRIVRRTEVSHHGSNEVDSRWWLAERGETGTIGYVPSNYLGLWPRFEKQRRNTHTFLDMRKTLEKVKESLDKKISLDLKSDRSDDSGRWTDDGDDVSIRSGGYQLVL